MADGEITAGEGQFKVDGGGRLKIGNDPTVSFEQMPQTSALPEVIDQQPEAIDLYKWAVLALAIIGGVGLLGCLILAFVGRDVPDGALVLASVAVGALAGMLGGQKANNA
jgi:hypothetical protein